MNTHIVVVSHEENIHWFPKANFQCPITFLNCGRFESCWWHTHNFSNNFFYVESEVIPSIKVPNAGKEAGMYLQYIIKNYKNLPERIIFVQADLGAVHLTWSLQNCLYKQLEKKIPEILKCKAKMKCFTVDFDFFDDVPILFPINNFVFSKINKKYSFPEKTFLGAVGAQFYIDKTEILKHPIKYYEDIYSLHDKCFLAGELEFSWPAVFQIEVQ